MRPLHISSMYSIAWIVLTIISIFAGTAVAQNLELENTTVTITTTYTAGTITAGPAFTVTSTGNATLHANTVAVKPTLVVEAGGKLQVVSGGVMVGIDTEDEQVPGLVDEFRLDQNYPNPFNPNTTIRFALKSAENVSLKIYNVSGQLVRTLINGDMGAGAHNKVWNAKTDSGNRVASGVYFYRIEAGAFTQMRKMILLK